MKANNTTFIALAAALTACRRLVSTLTIAILAIGCADEALAFGAFSEHEWGDTKFSSKDIGSADDITCFLSGMRGRIIPPATAAHAVELGGGVKIVIENPSQNVTVSRYHIYVNAAGRPVAVNVRCVNKVATRTPEVEWKNTGDAKIELASVESAHPMRRCFLTRITAACKEAGPEPCPGGFRDPTDWVRVWKDEDAQKWYLGGEIKTGPVTAAAQCIDVSEDKGFWEWGCGGATPCPAGESNRIPLAPDSLGTQCFLTHVRGSFNRDQPHWWDGVYITRPGIQFYLNTTSGKDGGVNCVR